MAKLVALRRTDALAPNDFEGRGYLRVSRRLLSDCLALIADIADTKCLLASLFFADTKPRNRCTFEDRTLDKAGKLSTFSPLAANAQR